VEEPLNFGLSADYVPNREGRYFLDAPIAETFQVHQPEVYGVAKFLLTAMGRSTVVDIGCGTGRKLFPHSACGTLIGIDFGTNIEIFARLFPDAQAVTVDLEQVMIEDLPRIAWADALVICSDVIEHLKDPTRVLKLLSWVSSLGAVIVISTPDREKVHRGHHGGPPVNPSHVREWSLDELRRLFDFHGIPFLFSGWTISDNFLRRRETSLGLVARNLSFPNVRADERPLGIVSSYNDVDIIEQLSRLHLKEGIDLYFIDNWSTDGTFDALKRLANEFPQRVKLERFPEVGPDREYRWAEILGRKAQVASHFPGRWILHIDSDELRLSPWPNVSLAHGLAAVRSAKFNAVDFCVVELPPTKDGFNSSIDPLNFFDRFFFSTHPAHFLQKRAWVQPPEIVDLSSSGGHNVTFSGRVVFPFRFLLLHYPIRSNAQGATKIFRDRKPRFSKEEHAERGWHSHYDAVAPNHRFIRDQNLFERFDLTKFREEYLAEIVTDVVSRREYGALLYPRLSEL
jgi:SAM-dependent methyltransferase